MYTITKNNIHISNSYQIRNVEEMRTIINEALKEAQALGIAYKRTVDSWIVEWKAHNFLYDHNIARDRTASVDLNENEKWFRIIGYYILAIFYKE